MHDFSRHALATAELGPGVQIQYLWLGITDGTEEHSCWKETLLNF